MVSGVTKCRYCKHNSLDPNVVAGKIVLCDKLYNGTGPFLAGALGSIMNEDLSVDDVAWNFPLPTSYVSHVNGSSILSYISSSRL